MLATDMGANLDMGMTNVDIVCSAVHLTTRFDPELNSLKSRGGKTS
jgi:hypothetical protein